MEKESKNMMIKKRITLLNLKKEIDYVKRIMTKKRIVIQKES